MSTSCPITLLALASHEKGHAFLERAKAEGARVLLLTSLSLKDSAHWPLHAIDEIFYMPDEQRVWKREDTLKAVSYLGRSEDLGRIVPLDDFDLELAAHLREHLRIPGMGETTVRHFRDKLAMRMRAEEAGIRVPEFCQVLNYAKLAEFLDRVPGPWVLKPRLYAGSIGIRKLDTKEQIWQALEQLGDEQSYYLVERYVPGSVFHVDSMVYEREIRHAIASSYGRPPLDVAQGGGVFTSRIVERGSETDQGLLEMNRRVLTAFGMVRGVCHTEFIYGQDGKLYFLETAARVGGAHIADLVEAATGLNLWGEWASIEIRGGSVPYDVRPLRQDYAGLLVSLANVERPDTSHYTDSEITWRMNKPWHVGFIVRSTDYQRVGELLCQLTGRVLSEFSASAPPPQRPTEAAH